MRDDIPNHDTAIDPQPKSLNQSRRDKMLRANDVRRKDLSKKEIALLEARRLAEEKDKRPMGDWERYRFWRTSGGPRPWQSRGKPWCVPENPMIWVDRRAK